MAAARAEQIPIKIELTTKIQHDNEQETYELTAFGQYYQKDNAVYLKYDEVQEEGTVHTIVKISGNEAVILRSGALKMRLSFLNGKPKNGSYESPYGTLMLISKTSELKHSQEKEKAVDGRFQLKYQLILQGSSVGVYEMNIDYKEEQERL
ncbi:DUF1934 domain-containing protein [Falsibacillus albus]|uniref:DUF1934 domain-containing protein n=1 Tax=Falsibacillus albus TaxID=2478915 RepID=UPI001F3120BA|nr:DUF1934 domain-containing protein [Falsibacillus albus]